MEGERIPDVGAAKWKSLLLQVRCLVLSGGGWHLKNGSYREEHDGGGGQ